MRHVFIVNPGAGKTDRSRAVAEAAQAAMERRGEPWELHLTRGPGHARDLAAAAAEYSEPVRIYACGGDGTLSECAAGAAGRFAATSAKTANTANTMPQTTAVISAKLNS